MKKEVSQALRSLIATVVFAGVIISLFQFFSGNPRAAATVDMKTIDEIISSHQKTNDWRKEKIPLFEHVTLEGAAMDDNASNDAKKIYEFSVEGVYLAIFIYHERESVDAAHMASFGSHDVSVTELYERLRLKIPTSFRGGMAMKSWLGEQDEALKP